MGNNTTKSQSLSNRNRPKKNVHWKSAGEANTTNILPTFVNINPVIRYFVVDEYTINRILLF